MTMTAKLAAHADPAEPASPWLERYYGVRALFSFLWVALAFTIGKAQPSIGIALLIGSMGKPDVAKNSVLLLNVSGSLPDYTPDDAVARAAAPVTVSVPVVMVRPVRMKTPAEDAEGPTVGAKCRGIVTAYAIGWLKLGGSCMVYGGFRMRV
mgnify:CR=1 FL=1